MTEYILGILTGVVGMLVVEAIVLYVKRAKFLRSKPRTIEDWALQQSIKRNRL